jgi:hypothetical protein
MSEETEKKQARSRREASASPQTPQTPTYTPPDMYASPTPTITAPPISPEVRDELTALMQDLLLKTHELSFEYSTLECDELSTCPLGKKCRELFRVVKKLNDTVRKMTPQPPTPYVR